MICDFVFVIKENKVYHKQTAILRTVVGVSQAKRPERSGLP
jgi:hypothetical protein